MAAVVAQLLKQRQRGREHTFKVRKVQSSWLATQPFPVLLAMADSGAGQARRVVPRALGKWRGSTLHDMVWQLCAARGWGCHQPCQPTTH